jgi:predicted nucleic acid-binding protein
MNKILVDSCVFINAFKDDSIHREECLGLLEYISQAGQSITMPAHGWFEVWCSLKRIEHIDKKFKGISIDGRWNYPIELIHIDDEFIRKYGNVQIPYIKAGDHIFIVVAYVNHYPLVTTDKKMKKIAKELGISVFSPAEYLDLKDAAQQ